MMDYRGKITSNLRGRDSILHGLSGVLRTFTAIACACLVVACASRSPMPETDMATPATLSEHHTVALLGATGMVGGYLLEEALARGYSVRALARTPAKLDQLSDWITVVQGDARDPVVIEELLRGSDVVISALGPVKADGEAARLVNTTVTGNVLQLMSSMDISQYIIVSGAAVVMPGDDRNILGWWIRTLAQIGLGDALRDKQAEYELLADASEDWMLVRCPLIEPQPYHASAMVSLQTPPAFHVKAGELAHFIFDQVDARAFIRKGPFVGSRQGE
jgi:hypothetical protein